jgi:hypothetical protein
MTSLRTAGLRLSALALLLVAVACSAGSARPDFEGSDAADASADGPREASSTIVSGDAKAPPPTGIDCERELAMGKLTISNAACFVNQHVENKTTKLEFLCAGGKAQADFDGHLFTGTVTADEEISLVNVEPFVFNNCDWISTEKIEGDLSKGTLRYTYSEKPKTTCPDNPCTASGDLEVEAGEVVVVR